MDEELEREKAEIDALIHKFSGADGSGVRITDRNRLLAACLFRDGATEGPTRQVGHRRIAG
jgi:hypothetical protein